MNSPDTKSAAIIGSGISRFATERSDKTIVGLAIEAIVNALADAGVDPSEVDGLIVTPTGRFLSSRIGYSLGEHLGMYPRTISAHNDGGSAATGLSLDIARWALIEGRCKYVVMVDAGKWSAVGRSGYQNWTLDRDRYVQYVSSWGRGVDPDQTQVWGGTWLSQAALFTERHMSDWGTTPAQLASVAASARRNASLNPDAVYRAPMSTDEVIASPMVSSPLRQLMCSMVNDGAAAVVVTRTDRARTLTQKPVELISSASRFGGSSLARHFGPLRNEVSIGTNAATSAFSSAGLSPADVDLACWNDPYATATIMALEDYGFCARGQGGPYVQDPSRISVGGELPVNTHGGWLSGTMAAGNHAALVELVRQLQGRGGRRQVTDAKIGFFAATGHWRLGHSVALLGVT